MNIGLDKRTKERIEPQKGRLAICQCCEADLIPKCGQFRVDHWAHKKASNCDKWWESETKWHRNWKNRFPINWREIKKINPNNTEKHIADIYIPSKDLVIEFQNSPIDKNELESREKFYKKMIWVLNAKDFKIDLSPLESFKKKIKEYKDGFLSKIKNNSIKIPNDVVEKLQTRGLEMLQNNRWNILDRQIEKLEKLFEQEIDVIVTQYINGKPILNGVNVGEVKNTFLQKILTSAINEYNKFIEKNKPLNEENQYYKYTWINRRKVWNYANQNIFLDMGQELLWIKSDTIIKKVPIDTFIAKYSND